ncbi:MAG: glycosyltransferase family 4 protein [Paludibacteraceae bacterium]|nr:glycosyltransferase family 4 protein [Paludibacteraceae bacterium]
MLRVLLIYPDYSAPITGGQYYDHSVVDTLASEKHVVLDKLLEKDLHCSHVWGYPLIFVRKLGQIRQYDMVLTNSRLYPWLLLLVALLRLCSHTRVVVIHHHFDYMMYSGMRRTLRRWLEVGFLRLCSETIIASPYVRDVFAQMLPNKPYHYWQLGLRTDATSGRGEGNETADYTPEAGDKNVKDVKDQVLFVGTIEPRKGVHHLVTVAQAFRERGLHTRIMVVGKVMDEAYYRQIQQRLHDCDVEDYFVFAGRQEMSELTRSYAQSLCFAFPSALEGYGMVLLEAMAQGCPCVVFDNSAMPYTVHNEVNGLVVEDQNSAAFAQAVVRMVTDQELRERCAQQAMADIAALPTFDNVRQHTHQYAQTLAIDK